MTLVRGVSLSPPAPERAVVAAGVSYPTTISCGAYSRLGVPARATPACPSPAPITLRSVASATPRERLLREGKARERDMEVS
jgi:hypothetical protein